MSGIRAFYVSFCFEASKVIHSLNLKTNIIRKNNTNISMIILVTYNFVNLHFQSYKR